MCRPNVNLDAIQKALGAYDPPHHKSVLVETVCVVFFLRSFGEVMLLELSDYMPRRTLVGTFKTIMRIPADSMIIPAPYLINT